MTDTQRIPGFTRWSWAHIAAKAPDVSARHIAQLARRGEIFAHRLGRRGAWRIALDGCGWPINTPESRS